jgi:hypothetical protein
LHPLLKMQTTACKNCDEVTVDFNIFWLQRTLYSEWKQAFLTAALHTKLRQNSVKKEKAFLPAAFPGYGNRCFA